jgi:YebC/PmpR family DNA-binding regulatory protein
MAGHSKWANIQHRKGRQDEKRGKIWTKLIREITVAAKMGGGDTATNPRLRLAIDKAKDSNMPNDNVQRAVQRGTGSLEGVNYEEIRYEGYGLNGAAVIVDALTDNRTRTVAEVRHAFTKHGGNLGSDGSVAFLFKHCGRMFFAPGTSEDDVIPQEDGSIEVVTPPYEFAQIKDALIAKGFSPEMGEVTMRPDTETDLSGEDAIKMQKLLDALESLDDVQEVFTNASME